MLLLRADAPADPYIEAKIRYDAQPGKFPSQDAVFAAVGFADPVPAPSAR
jgi:hypothetical protein